MSPGSMPMHFVSPRAARVYEASIRNERSGAMPVRTAPEMPLGREWSLIHFLGLSAPGPLGHRIDLQTGVCSEEHVGRGEHARPGYSR